MQINEMSHILVREQKYISLSCLIHIESIYNGHITIIAHMSINVMETNFLLPFIFTISDAREHVYYI